MTQVLITKLHHDVVLPEYATKHAAGMDLRAYIARPLTLAPMERQLLPTGIAIALPNGYEAQVRARSGLSFKHGVTMVNGIGTIDADYRGEIKVPLINLGSEPFVIEPEMRIAQLVVLQYRPVVWHEVASLDVTERDNGGFGSTGHA